MSSNGVTHADLQQLELAVSEALSLIVGVFSSGTNLRSVTEAFERAVKEAETSCPHAGRDRLLRTALRRMRQEMKSPASGPDDPRHM